jgi:hypothetical protein
VFGSGTMDLLRCFVGRIHSLKQSHLRTTSSVPLLSDACFLGRTSSILNCYFLLLISHLCSCDSHILYCLKVLYQRATAQGGD